MGRLTAWARGAILGIVTALMAVGTPVPLAWSQAPAPAGREAGTVAESKTQTSKGFVGNKTSHVYHRPDCALVKRLPTRSKLALTDVAAAGQAGFEPCPACHPDQVDDQDHEETDAGPPAQNEPNSEPAGISFRRDIAPVLVGNCIGCHNPKDKTRRGDLDLTTFAAIIEGGKTGPIVAAGDPGLSLILKRVRGEDGPKMPPGDRRLAPETIDRIEAWIRDGAKLDAGLAPTAELAKIAPRPDELRRSRLKEQPAEKRIEQVETLGRDRWKKAASTDPTVVSNPRFVVLHRLPDARAKDLLRALDASASALVSLYGPAAEPILKGPEPVSIYVLEDRNAYVEFIRSVENGTAEESEHARARLDAPEAPYLVIEDPQAASDVAGADAVAGEANPAARRPRRSRNLGAAQGGSTDDRTLSGVAAEALGAAVPRQIGGNPPQWLALGLGAMLGARAEPRNVGYYQGLRRQAARGYSVSGVQGASELLGGQGESAATRALGFSLLEWLQSAQPKSFGAFVRAVQKDGTKLDDVLSQGLGVTREQFLAAWAASVDPRILQDP